MVRFDTCSGCMKTMVAVVLFWMPGCASLQDAISDKPDPALLALQRENRQIVRNQMSIQKAVEDFYKRLNALDAKLDFLEDQVQQLALRQKTLVSTPKKPPTSMGKKPKTAPEVKKVAAKKKTKKAVASTKRASQRQYDQAYSAYVAQRYDEALALFKNFLKNYPRHDLADNAQYWVGEIYYDLENYPSAILAFKEVVTKYGDKNKAPDALLKIGYAYIALDDPSNARLFLKRVIKNYPFSDAEAKARVKLKEIQNL